MVKYKIVLSFTVVLCCLFFNGYSQTIYTNNMDYVLGDAKQAFITNAIKSEAQADNLLKGFKNLKVNGIRIPIFPRDVNGIDINPNKPIMDYFYNQALAQGFLIFANPAQGGGGKRIANNTLGDGPGVNGVQAATDELIARMLEFSNEYPGCKWLNPFNEDGRATSSTWSVAQYHTIYGALYNNVNGAELIGPCPWGLPAGIDMLRNTNIADYITVATTHNLGFNHGQWSTFIALADAENLPVWDSEVNHSDKFGTGTRLEKAIENEVDGLVLYNSWNTISLLDGTINSGAQNQMVLYLKDYEIPELPVYTNLALNGVATQSSTNPSFNKFAHLAIDGNTNGNFGGGSVTVTNGEPAPWWQVDLGSDTGIGAIKIFNRTDSCCRARMANFTVSVIDSNGNVTFSKTYDTHPNPSFTVDTEGGIVGQIVRIVLNNQEENHGLTLAEVQVFGLEALSVNERENVEVVMYPNPVVDKLNIISPNADFSSYTLFNINGQAISTHKIKNNESKLEINVSELPKGFYLLKLDGVKSSGIYKIIKD